MINLDFDKLSFENSIIIYEIASCNGVSAPPPSSTLSIKELQKLTIIKLWENTSISNNIYLKFYRNYIIKYKETINECHIDDEKEIDGSSNSSNSSVIKQQLIKFKELLRLFQIFDNLKNKYIIIEKQESIFKDCIDGTLEWNEVLNEIAYRITGINKIDGDDSKIIINDKETIDWISRCKNSPIIAFILDNLNKLSIGSLEFANQLYESRSLKERLFYSNVWYEAIRNSDFRTIDYIVSLDINIFQLSLYDDDHESSLNQPIPINQTINFINHFNETGFTQLNERFSLSLLFTQIVNSLFYHGCTNEQQQQILSNIKLNFRNLKSHNDIVYCLLTELGRMDLRIVELLLNSNVFTEVNQYDLGLFDKHPFAIISNHYQNRNRNLFPIVGDVYQEEHIELCYYNKDETHDSGGGASKFEIIELIKKLVNRSFKPTFTRTKRTYNDTLMTFDPISSIVNYLFEELITIKGITIKEVVEIYQIIQNNSIIIEHTIYHSFWYLHIKDIKLSFYIMGNKKLIELLSNDREGYYDCSTNHIVEDELVYLQDYLKPSEFKLESINNLPFDTLLEMMVNKLSPISIIPKYRINFKIYNELLNWELEYYLIIRNDLFFKKLHQIKLEIDEFNNNSNKYYKKLFPKELILYNSPSNTLLSNSTLFNNSQDEEGIELTPIIPSNLIDDFNKFKIQPLVYTFEFSDKVFEAIVNLLNLDEIKRVIKFGYYQTSFQYRLFNQSINYQRFEISKLILDNFKIIITEFPISIQDDDNDYISIYPETSFLLNNYFKFIQLPCKFELLENEIYNESFKFKFIYLLNNYFKFEVNGNTLYNQFISSTTSRDDKMKILNDANLKINTTTDDDDEIKYEDFNTTNINDQSTQTLFELYKNDEYQLLFNQFFKSIEQQQQQDHQPSSHYYSNSSNSNNQAQQQEVSSSVSSPPHSCNYNECEDNIFLSTFIKGDIKTSELILSHYHSNYQFKLTNQSISKTIENGNIHIINHYLNNHKSMFDCDDDLLNHLKSELNNHKDYKYLNIL